MAFHHRFNFATMTGDIQTNSTGGVYKSTPAHTKSDDGTKTGVYHVYNDGHVEFMADPVPAAADSGGAQAPDAAAPAVVSSAPQAAAPDPAPQTYVSEGAADATTNSTGNARDGQPYIVSHHEGYDDHVYGTGDVIKVPKPGQHIGAAPDSGGAQAPDAAAPAVVSSDPQDPALAAASDPAAQTNQSEGAVAPDSTVPAPPDAPQPSLAEMGAATHIVEQGEGLYAIADKNGISHEQIVAWNPQIADKNHINPGQSVNIGAPAAAAPAADGGTPLPTSTTYPPTDGSHHDSHDAHKQHHAQGGFGTGGFSADPANAVVAVAPPHDTSPLTAEQIKKLKLDFPTY